MARNLDDDGRIIHRIDRVPELERDDADGGQLGGYRQPTPWGVRDGDAWSHEGRFLSDEGIYGSRGDESWGSLWATDMPPELTEQRFEPGGVFSQETHRGRGPKNYRRLDARILEDICDLLHEDPHIDASEVEVEVHEGEVTLSGRVADRRAKRIAENIAESVRGVRECHNRLRTTPAR